MLARLVDVAITDCTMSSATDNIMNFVHCSVNRFYQIEKNNGYRI